MTNTRQNYYPWCMSRGWTVRRNDDALWVRYCDNEREARRLAREMNRMYA